MRIRQAWPPDYTDGVFWTEFSSRIRDVRQARVDSNSLFHISRNGLVVFPLWYPALVFALAGIGALRLGRRFTLRSAIIATAVVAGLLGMVVAL
jgi:hypothetical protein